MDLLTAPLTTQAGLSITVQAWPYLQFTANYLDFRALLTAYREHVEFGADSELPQQPLLDRVLERSVPDGKDRELIASADVPDLLETIFQLNRLESLASKPLRLYQRLLQAEASGLEPSTPPAT